jgi:hypothetical protein
MAVDGGGAFGGGGGSSGGGGGGGNGGNGGGPLPAHCPCPLGSYCDLATQTCKRGCLGNDQCPADQRCDTTVFLCAPRCDFDMGCAGHMPCAAKAGDGNSLCAVCRPGDMGIVCPCVKGYADCNRDGTDGCETPLGTLTDCHACGQPATTMCYQDLDGDNFGAGSGKLECDCTAGTVSTPGDCDDGARDVHPGQMSFFTQPSKAGSWDYDCDNKIEY